MDPFVLAATAATVSAILWYYQRSQAPVLQRTLVCALIFVAGVAVAVVGPDAIRFGYQHLRRLTLAPETVDPLRRIVHVGGRAIILPAPPGFVMVGPELPEFLKALEADVTDNNRRVVSLVSKETHAKLVAGEQVPVRRILFVDVSRKYEQVRFRPADFAHMIQGVRKYVDDFMATTKEQIPELYAKLQRDFGRSLSENEQRLLVRLPDVTMLPMHRDTERIVAFSTIKREKDSSDGDMITVVTTSMVLVKDLVLHLRVTGSYQDREWSRQVSDQWADAVLAANVD